MLLWEALPDRDRDRATVWTDVRDRAAVPEDRHAPGGKGSGLTAHVERFGLTLRQRCGRFVRKALSFSRCPENHVGPLGLFVRYYNAPLQRGHYPEVTCNVPRGGLLAVRPLLLHASSVAANPSRRMVLHIEYAAVDALPDGLEWHEAHA